MPQRISDDELNLALTNWKFAAALKMDLRRQWVNELAEDLRDTRAALTIAVEALEYTEASLYMAEGGIGDLLSVMKAVEIHTRIALDRIKQIVN